MSAWPTWSARRCGCALGDRHIRTLTVLGFPNLSRPGILDALNHQDFTYRWVTRFIALDKTGATKILTRLRRQWFNKRKSVTQLLREVMYNHLMPLSSVWAGPARNAHLDGPPLLLASTAGSTPFRLSTHVGDVGHMLVMGPTGAGKSVLVSLMALQFRRYARSRVIVFDMGFSARAAVLAMGGSHHSLGPQPEHGDGIGLSFQPLRHIDDDGERGWAADWITSGLNSTLDRSDRRDLNLRIRSIGAKVCQRSRVSPVSARSGEQEGTTIQRRGARLGGSTCG